MSVQKVCLKLVLSLLVCSWTSILAQAPANEVPPAETPEATEKTVIVLAMHGEPPKDFPKDEFADFFSLQAQLELGGTLGVKRHQQYAELDAKMRAWPRTAENDPFYAGSQEMARHLREATGYEVIVGFNDFCAPTLDEALEEAVARKPEKVIVITPMMTPGGGHSEIEIPAAVRRAREWSPDIPILYAWPFDLSELARFLAERIDRASEEMN